VETVHNRLLKVSMPPNVTLPNIDSNRSMQHLLSAQLRLVYDNATLGAAVNVLAATILCGLLWHLIPRPQGIGWWLYIAVVTGFRYTWARRYRRASPVSNDLDAWRRAFLIGVGMAAAGWGAAGVLLYPRDHLGSQVILIFVLGGMMLGASSLLTPLTAAFVPYLSLAGLIPTFRLLADGDETHISMGLLTGIFTIATLLGTRRMHRTIIASLRLQFENQELVEELRAANQQVAVWNLELEQHVEERTAELRLSTEQLKTEIAQRQQAEEELLRARKLESLGVLAGGIAHDFNNFLTVVQGNIEVAKSQLSSAEPAQSFLDQAANACQRAKFLSTQLLTFAKGGTPVRRVVSMTQLIADAVHLAQTGSHVRIVTQLVEGLWSSEVDPGQIGQVLHNILLNAREATTGSGAIEVRASNIAGDDSEPWVRITIRDEGTGIAPDTLRRIFDPYFSTKPGGSGLGLATAYAIVSKHGGVISAKSTPGIGTQFTIDLPASTANPQPPVILPRTTHTGTERLLVMDDDPSLGILSQAVLAHLGYDVEVAADGVEAIALYQKAADEGRCFDAVLLDLTVPGGMGGVEAATKLRQLDPTVKLIVSSGYSDAPVMSRFSEYGFDAVIEKPWTVQAMSEVLRTVLAAVPSGGFDRRLPNRS
jgi:signal transduction histidine kinase/ActR/RegA family two-component response regulator